jgi:hypothetical protein
MTGTQKTGRATITLKTGATYVADHTELRANRLTFTGRRRITNLTGRRYYETKTRTVTLGQVRAIWWHDGRGKR